MSTTTDTELRQAVSVIRDAACGNGSARRDVVVAAHQVVFDHRHDQTGSVHDAISAYLEHTTWMQGPFVLRDAICQLARHLELPVHDELDSVVEQLCLFDP